MTKLKTTIALFISAVFILGSLSGETRTSTDRGPSTPERSWTTQTRLNSVADYAALKPGDQVAQICKKCDSVSTLTIQSKAEAMELCEEGKMVQCNSCGHKAKSKNRSASAGNAERRVGFYDDHGDECMYMVKLGSVLDKRGDIHERH